MYMCSNRVDAVRGVYGVARRSKVEVEHPLQSLFSASNRYIVLGLKFGRKKKRKKNKKESVPRHTP